MAYTISQTISHTITQHSVFVPKCILNNCVLVQDIITMQVVTPSALQLNITASQSVLVRDVQNALMQQFVGMGHEEWIDGKLLCDGEILSCNRTVRYYVDEEQQYKEPFGSIYWVVDCLVNTGIEFLHGIASCSVVGMP